MLRVNVLMKFWWIATERLSGYLDKNNLKPQLIVLHQMGSHGPAYFKAFQKRRINRSSRPVTPMPFRAAVLKN